MINNSIKNKKNGSNVSRNEHIERSHRDRKSTAIDQTKRIGPQRRSKESAARSFEMMYRYIYIVYI